jgi:thiaminase
MDARTLVAEIRDELEGIDARMRQHPYVLAVEAGRVPRDRLRLFAGEQRAIIESDLRSVAYLVSRFGASDSRDYFLGVLQGERAAWEALGAFARALEMSDDELRAYEPMPGAHAYTAYMAWLALYGSDAAVAAAYLINFPAWGEMCGRMSRALQRRYGFGAADVAFFDHFATPPPNAEADALAVIEGGLAAGADPLLVRRAVRLLQGYELMFWDTLHAASGD